MAKEADDNSSLEPAATRELIDAALEAVKSQGLDINPYSVAREAGIAPESLFTNSQLMTLVISARGDQSTFSIDSHLVERCQELEGETTKILAINQEIYDRALEMEERVIELEAKISDMEQDAENLTMQLQNSWHLGYKKGLNDGQSETIKASHRPMIDIELPKEEAVEHKEDAVEHKEAKQSIHSLLDIELPAAQKQPTQSLLDIQLPEAQKQPTQSLLDIELPEVQKLSRNSLPAIQLPKEEKLSSKSLIDIELPEAAQPTLKSLLDIELPEAPKQPQTIKSLLDIELPETQRQPQTIKSLLDIELPEAEKPSIKSLIDIELPEAEKPSIKSLIDIELPEAEKPSIKSLLDIELPKENAASQTDFSAEQGKDTVDSPPVSGDHEPVVEVPVAQGQADGAEEVPPPAVAAKEPDTAQSYNDRVFNAVSDGWTQGKLLETYGGLSWREVETIYQYSASGGAAGPNLVFEPLAPGQAVGARATEPVEGKVLEPTNAEASGAVAASDGESNSGFNRGDTQPIPSRSDTQPLFALTPSADDAKAPPILKADAAASRPQATAAAAAAGHTESTEPLTPAAAPSASSPSAKPSPRATFTNLTGRPITTDKDPPMERTMSQFLGDTGSYINLDKVTMEPLGDAAPLPLQALPSSSNQSYFPPPSQEETQTLAGATAALAAEVRARAAAMSGASPGAPAASAAPPSAAASASLGPQTATSKPTGPTDPKWVKRDANATYDGLSAMESDSTMDVLDLEKLDIFEGLEDIDELSQIEVIEDVIIPGMAPPPQDPSKKPRYKSSEHIPVVSSDDLHDLIKSRIKKAEEPHEPPRLDAFVSGGSADKAPGTGAGTSSTSGLHSATGAPAGSGTSALSGAAPGAEPAAPAPVPTAKELEALRQGARNKFVGGKASSASSPMGGGSDSAIGTGTGTGYVSVGASARAVPPEIRKACMILGVRPEDLTLKEVNEKWKSQLSAPGVHPDQGGDTESAIYLNTAKDTLVKWINDQNSKMGKKFKPKDEKDK
jgi:hypothetical protein